MRPSSTDMRPPELCLSGKLIPLGIYFLWEDNVALPARYTRLLGLYVRI